MKTTNMVCQFRGPKQQFIKYQKVETYSSSTNNKASLFNGVLDDASYFYLTGGTKQHFTVAFDDVHYVRSFTWILTKDKDTKMGPIEIW